MRVLRRQMPTKLFTKPMVNTTCTISKFYTTYRFSVQLARKRYIRKNVGFYSLGTLVGRIDRMNQEKICLLLNANIGSVHHLLNSRFFG